MPILFHGCFSKKVSIINACQITNIYGSSGYLAENAANDMWNNYYKYLADARLFDKLVADYDKDLNLANVIAQKNTINALKTFKMLDIFGISHITMLQKHLKVLSIFIQSTTTKRQYI